MRFTIVDSCPVPSKVGPQVKTLKEKTGGRLQSAYRGEKARGLLRRLGKSTQLMLYNLFLAGRGNPANRPGQSTHELFSDAVAYRGPMGRPLAQWQCGMDWDDAHVPELIAEGHRHGWYLVRPYPSGSEYHHLNFVKEPRMPRLILKHGAKGAAVKTLTKRLMVIHDEHGEPYLTEQSRTYTERVAKAVRAFQHDHHLPTDGIVGPKTMAQLLVSYRYHKRKRSKR